MSHNAPKKPSSLQRLEPPEMKQLLVKKSAFDALIEFSKVLQYGPPVDLAELATAAIEQALINDRSRALLVGRLLTDRYKEARRGLTELQIPLAPEEEGD
ncbi:hypothetical protein [Burkholderia gladioli]|uniref:hypothetical protein n=1 Tax=Burkholderia gladioli TaxID=28095 RepID=UPI002FDF127D